MSKHICCLLWVCVLAWTASARADIFRWDNGQLIPGTVGIEPGPGVQLNDRQLEYARLFNLDLTGSRFDFSNLANAKFIRATFTNANLTGANLASADFDDSPLTNANLTGANLANTNFGGSTLTNASLAGAVVTGARFGYNPGFTASQLYSTQSYQDKNLSGIVLDGNNLTSWDFHEQNLANSRFADSTLTNANLTSAVVTGANFDDTTSRGFTASQLYSTRSYQDKILSGIELSVNDLTGWDFHEQNLANAIFFDSTLTNANLTGANLANTYLGGSTLTNTKLDSANLRNSRLDDANGLTTAKFSVATIYNQWTIFPNGFDPISMGLTRMPSPDGDFDANDVLNVADIDMLQRRIRARGIPPWYWLPDAMFDVNEDERVDAADVRTWVLDAKRTFLGDTDLNGKVDFSDFLSLSSHFGESGRWSDGDFDTSGDIQFADFLLLSSNFGKTSAVAIAVPEPSFCFMASVGLCGLTLGRPRRFLTPL